MGNPNQTFFREIFDKIKSRTEEFSLILIFRKKKLTAIILREKSFKKPSL